MSSQPLHIRVHHRVETAFTISGIQVARDLGIRVNQLRKWRLDFELEDRTSAQTPAAIPGDDLRGLRRENVRLRDEIELLKKAAMYFARGSR